MKVNVDYSKYLFAYGKNPRGYGTWWFRIGSSDDDIAFSRVGTFKDCKRLAVQFAKQLNVQTIYVLP